jgi:hypothetical protein
VKNTLQSFMQRINLSVKERLLQFIWQKQYFNRGELATTRGEALEIIHPGRLNSNQGPDFLDGRVKIGATVWAGNIELHLFSSGWDLHGHGNDRNFRNVILHVVWEDDVPGQSIPVLELKDRIPAFLVSRYEQLMQEISFIPCEKMFGNAGPELTGDWLDRLLRSRVQRKAENIRKRWAHARNDWAEVYWWMLAANFGHSVNTEAFEALARATPLSLLNRHRNQLQQVEAILLGQAGLLESPFTDHYPLMLQKEYRFLRHKYGLRPIVQPVHFLRMRPANFPTLRLAQLAALIHSGGHLPELVREADQLHQVREAFDIRANDYWQTHYLPDKCSTFSEKRLGNAKFDNILINTIVPFIFTYAEHHGDELLRQKAMNWLGQTEAESNTVIRGFRALGLQAGNAAESQALLELKSGYCDQKNCLNCDIGKFLLQPGS